MMRFFVLFFLFFFPAVSASDTKGEDTKQGTRIADHNTPID